MSIAADNDDVRFLLILLEQAPKIDWNLVAPKVGKTANAVSKQYKRIRARYANEDTNTGSPATPSKRGRGGKGKAQASVSTHGASDDDEEDDETPIKKKRVKDVIKEEEEEEQQF